MVDEPIRQMGEREPVALVDARDPGPGARLEATIRVAVGTWHVLDDADEGFHQRAVRAGILDVRASAYGRVEFVMGVRLPDEETTPTVERVHAIALRQVRDRLAGIVRADAPLLGLEIGAYFEERSGVVS